MKINRTKGFTLIEFLIIIAILGILAAGVVVVIDPVGKINSANLAKAKTFSASVENLLSISQVGKWSFESVDANSKTPDTSGYGNDGTLGSASMWKPATDPLCKELGFGGCLKFDGVDDYMNTNYNFGHDFDSGVAWCVWVKPNNISSGERYYINASSGFGGVQAFSLRHQGGGRYSFLWTLGVPGGLDSVYSTSSVTTNWAHVCGVWDTKAIAIFVNGVKENSHSSVGSADTPTSTIRIGMRNNDGFYDGLIDEVQIYNKALTISQIQQLYAQGLIKHQLAME